VRLGRIVSATESNPHAESWETLMWLADALEQAYSQGRVVLLDYLEAVMDEVLFEMEMAVRKPFTVG
jgi:hypothetical protein